MLPTFSEDIGEVEGATALVVGAWFIGKDWIVMLQVIILDFSFLGVVKDNLAFVAVVVVSYL